MTELRALADSGNKPAQDRLFQLVSGRGDEAALTELRALADTGNKPAQDRLARLLAARGDENSMTALRTWVLTGTGGLELLSAYRRRSAYRHISELDCEARAVYSDRP